MAVRSTQGQNRAVRSTQGGCHPQCVNANSDPTQQYRRFFMHVHIKIHRKCFNISGIIITFLAVNKAFSKSKRDYRTQEL